MKLNRIDRSALKLIESELDKAMREVAEKFGLKYERKPGRFSDKSFDGRFTLSVLDENGEVKGAKEQFEMMAPMFGADPSWYGRSFRDGRQVLTVASINPKAPKNCINLESEDGRSYRCSPGYVQMKLPKAS